MSKRECLRCHERFSEDGMFYLSIGETGGESGFSCEDCLLPYEQDYFFGQYFPILTEPATSALNKSKTDFSIPYPFGLMVAPNHPEMMTKFLIHPPRSVKCA